MFVVLLICVDGNLKCDTNMFIQTDIYPSGKARHWSQIVICLARHGISISEQNLLEDFITALMCSTKRQNLFLLGT
ncbi:hypothetical protein T05_12517 [Trichinella murrelli]|uniref:Uncharacterized protein n=1 Tax=Trichinella murrelli TaxID=144512 RepID=A0A0V0TUV2_9BILA|nr:hypothetical protein T05_12517 [Trichinella murrelli]